MLINVVYRLNKFYHIIFLFYKSICKINITDINYNYCIYQDGATVYLERKVWKYEFNSWRDSANITQQIFENLDRYM